MVSFLCSSIVQPTLNRISTRSDSPVCSTLWGHPCDRRCHTAHPLFLSAGLPMKSCKQSLLETHQYPSPESAQAVVLKNRGPVIAHSQPVFDNGQATYQLGIYNNPICTQRVTRGDPVNYLSVSLTCMVGKITEGVIAQHPKNQSFPTSYSPSSFKVKWWDKTH